MPDQKFQIGDHVQLVESAQGHGPTVAGEVVKINETTDGVYLYTVKLETPIPYPGEEPTVAGVFTEQSLVVDVRGN